MATRRTYFMLLFSTPLVFLTCGKDRRNNAHHFMTETGVSLGSELWSKNDFDLMAPTMSGYIPSQILERLGYTASYNHNTKCSNWVAWNLTKDRADGLFPRKGVPYYDEDGIATDIGTVTPKTQCGDYSLYQEAEEYRQLLSDWSNNNTT